MGFVTESGGLETRASMRVEAAGSLDRIKFAYRPQTSIEYFPDQELVFPDASGLPVRVSDAARVDRGSGSVVDVAPMAPGNAPLHPLAVLRCCCLAGSGLYGGG